MRDGSELGYSMKPDKSTSDVSPWAVVAALAIICATIVAVVWLIVR